MASGPTGNPYNGGGAFSIGTSTTTNSQLSNNHNNLTPPRTPSPAVEEPPSLTVDDPTILSSTNTSNSLNQEHWQCILNMEALDNIVLHPPTRNTFDFIRSLLKILAFIFSYGITRVYVVICAVLSIISLKALTMFLAISIATFIFFYLPHRHRTIVANRKDPRKLWPRKRTTEMPFYVLLVCGSGGHTTEMIKMVERSIRSEGPYSHRRWAVGYGDDLSYKRVMDFERRLNSRFTSHNLNAGTYDIMFFHRSRAVHQSWWTTPFSVCDCSNDALDIITTPAPNPTISEFKLPGVIVTDGPGTGLVFLMCVYLMKFFALVHEDSMKCVFVESWARVNSLSFSGMLIKFFQLADVFIIQHRPLHRRNPRHTYTGNMVVMPTIPSVPTE
ncbi:glycosyltransferase family 1 protein [Daldinia decipiens]|uniref:glycosyltransferase family 1 protein n=1 Tax=Daldinia decipiens TaxID=326647 RepID=UPI0020C3326A|nr:glycosyltransferase family 1 protein [Daldinia decipiens]KAI1657514.1 glycosyltransferase family 1 protein [Daldinia decipiens]